MAVEVQLEEEVVLRISDRVFEALASGQDVLLAKAGLRVSAYGTQVVSPKHCALWSDGLRRHAEEWRTDGRLWSAYEGLLRVLERAVDRDCPVVVEGE